MLVAPDTSPRGPRLPGDDASWDFGLAAGFYVDATQAPWSAHYRMYSYVTRELPALMQREFATADTTRQSIMGHSMGGHGALVCALRNAAPYRSVSAFAPIVAPSKVPWGHKAFGNYLGANRTDWLEYDATHLVQRAPRAGTILVDQYSATSSWPNGLRGPDLLFEAASARGRTEVVVASSRAVRPRLLFHPVVNPGSHRRRSMPAPCARCWSEGDGMIARNSGSGDELQRTPLGDRRAALLVQ